MAKLTITGTVPQLDGEYELDLSAGFTKQEYFLMKQKVGVVAGDLAPGAPIDMNVLTAFGIVVLARNDLSAYLPMFMETTDTQTDWDFDEAEVGEDDALPPPSAPAATEDSVGSSTISGGSSEPSGASQGDDLSRTGSLRSVTTAV
jgi:hypothetical protein